MARLLVSMCLAVMACIWGCGAYACVEPDVDFASFIRRFGNDLGFQQARTQDPIKIGETKLVRGDEKFVWREASSSAGLKVYRFPGQAERRNKGLKYETVNRSNDRVSVRIFLPETDVDDITYFFRNMTGCWYLVAIENNSL